MVLTLRGRVVRRNAVSRLWAIIFFIIFVLFMFFVVLNIFLAILNDAYTVVHTQSVWEELEKRKPLSLREKFEVRRAMWRERRNIARLNRMKREKVKEDRKRKKEYAADPAPPHPTEL